MAATRHHQKHGRSSSSFREKRMALDALPMTRPPRGKLSALLVERFWRDSEGLETFWQKRDFKELSKAQTCAARQELVSKFPNHIIDVLHYHGIDQGQEGACSLVALIHVILLSDNVNVSSLLSHFFVFPST